jgi:hypothetical protein
MITIVRAELGVLHCDFIEQDPERDGEKGPAAWAR